MKLLILSCLAALVAADVSHLVPKPRQSGDDKDAQILKQDSDISPDGAYSWSFEASNGNAAQAEGQLKQIGDQAGVVSQGQARWVSPEGEQIQFQYVADENGYQPQGSHLPTPPPIPEAILRSLEYIKANPPAPEN